MMKNFMFLFFVAYAISANAQTAVTGQAKYGTWPANNDFAYFTHQSLNSANSNTNYALLQSSDGRTYLNSKSNMGIHVRLGNVDQMTFKSTGIGIGITNPTAQLHLFGKGADLKIDDTPGSTDNSADIYLQNLDGNDVVINKTNIFAEGTGTYIHAQGVDLAQTQLSLGVNWDHAITMRNGMLVGIGTDSPVERFHVVGKSFFAGQVGIGTQNVPTGYGLAVSGGILAEKVKVAVEGSADWADYVFDESYQLMKLEDLYEFVIKNSHLPKIPSTKELQESGLDLAEMQKLQMEKIEELTLYVIQLYKENELLQKEMLLLKDSSKK